MHYHQFNFNDFIGCTRFLKNSEIAIFIKLQIQYLQDEKPLKDNVIFLTRLCDASEEETLNVLKMFYDLKDGSWHRDQLDQIIFEYKSNLDANSRGGKRSAELRKIKALASNYTSTGLQVTNNQEPVNQELINQEARIKNQSTRFNEFWSLYPSNDRKTKKIDCLDTWVELNCDAVAENIFNHLNYYLQTEDWLNGFNPSPLSYLKQMRWLDFEEMDNDY